VCSGIYAFSSFILHRTYPLCTSIARHLQGERLKQKIGEIVLKGGDVLLLDTGVFVSCNLGLCCIYVVHII
jgi:hypothetical protein